MLRAKMGDSSASPESIVSEAKLLAAELAASHEIEKAKRLYLDMVASLADYSVSSGRQLVPSQMLEDALLLAEGEHDRAIVHFMLAWELAGSADPFQRARAGAEFAQSGNLASRHLREQMLLRHAQWAEKDGYSNVRDDGRVQTGADFGKAIQLYDELSATASKPELVKLANDAAERIRKASISLSIGHSYRSGSQVQFQMSWRNCESIDLIIHQVDPSSLNIAQISSDPSAWANAMPADAESKAIRRLTFNTPPPRPHHTSTQEVKLGEIMAPGIYLVSASSGSLKAREVLIVSDSMLTLKIGRSEVLAFACSAISGSPLSGANIRIWARNPASAEWTQFSKKAGEDGVALFSSADMGGRTELGRGDFFAIASSDQQHAIASYKSSPSDAGSDELWTAFNMSDSCCYERGQTAHFVSLIRRKGADRMLVPEGSAARLDIVSSDGTNLASLKTSVDSSGISMADWPLPLNAVPGQYVAKLYREAGGLLGEELHFNILDEQEHAISLTLHLRQRAEGQTYKVGETIRGSLLLQAPFGVELAGQSIELSVEECNYDAASRQAIGPWRTILRQQLRTDSIGESAFSIKSTASTESDYQYRIQAIIRNSEGQLLTSAQTITYATRRDIHARLRTDRVLYERGQAVSLALETLSASGAPLPCSGRLRLMRESWKEVWVNRRGQEISGEQMLALRRRGGGWFSFGQSAGDYMLKSQGYVTSMVQETELSSDESGRAHFEWKDASPGYYRFVWIGEARRGTLVSNESQFWVSGSGSEVSGYRPGSLKIITNSADSSQGDKGDMALVTVPSPNQHVLLLTGTDSIESWKLLQMQDTAQLVRIADTPASSSGTYLEAICAYDEKQGRDIVPMRSPPPQLLKVMLEADRNAYEAGQPSQWTVTVRDSAGKPIKGASIVFTMRPGQNTESESLRAPIQSLFPPIRRPHSIATASSIAIKPFYQPISATSGRDEAGSPATSAQAVPNASINPSRPSANSRASGIWMHKLQSGTDGRATFTLEMPRILSDWNATAIVSVADGRAGLGTLPVSTTETLSASMNAPDSLYAGDLVRFRALLGNKLPQEITLLCDIASKGLNSIQPQYRANYVTLRPGENLPVYWDAAFANAGKTAITVSASGAGKNLRLVWDMMVKPDPRVRHEQLNIYAGQASISIPKGAKPTDYSYRMTASPSRTALAAMRYLLEDPSTGSTEAAARIATIQSLRRMFDNMRFDPPAIAQALEQSGASQYMETRMADDLATLERNQNESGAWGWMSADASDAFSTAFNLLMLNLCDGKMRETLEPALERARSYAAAELVSGTHGPDMQVLLLTGLATRELGQTRPSRLEARVMVNLMRSKDRLSPFALACLTLCARQYGFNEEAADLTAQLRRLAVPSTDRISGQATLHWKGSDIPGAVPASDVEATAMSALALLTGGSGYAADLDKAIRHVFGKSINGHWDGPRETALCVFMFRDTAAITGETDLSARIQLFIGDALAGTYDYAKDFKLSVPEWNALSASDTSAEDAATTLQVRKAGGQSPVFFSLNRSMRDESPSLPSSSLPGASLERSYLRSIQVPTLLNGFVEEILPMKEDSPLRVGERIEVLLRLKLDAPMPRLIIVEPRPSFATHRHNEKATTLNLTNASAPESKPARMAISHSADSLVICLEYIPAGEWELRYPLRVDYEGVFIAPEAAAFPPQRPSIRATSGWTLIRSTGEE